MGKRFFEIRNGLTGRVRKVRVPDRAPAKKPAARNIEVKVKADTVKGDDGGSDNS